MKILATDLDRTLLPNGHWQADDHAIKIFNQLTQDSNVMLVYVTGRNLNLTEQAMHEYGVRQPAVLIGDVGTTIRSYSNGQWQYDNGWIEQVTRRSPRWDNQAIKNALQKIDGLTEQDSEHQNRFKQSYFVDHENRQSILKTVDDRIKGHFDETLIYSFDSQNGMGLLDVLPDSANKLTALEYLAEEYKVDKSQVVFCGDSGNDILPLTAGFNGVLVRNADQQLVEQVETAMLQNPQLTVYFAQGDFKGLNGYYTSGVIEGAYHYGVFRDTD